MEYARGDERARQLRLMRLYARPLAMWDSPEDRSLRRPNVNDNLGGEEARCPVGFFAWWVVRREAR